MNASDYVVPISIYPVNNDTLNKTVCTKSAYYAMNTWWAAKGLPNGIPSPALALSVGVRNLSNVAIHLANVGRYGSYYSPAASLDIAKVRLNAARLIAACANSHRSNYPGGWDSDRTWQSSLAAFNVGFAAWLLWTSDLTNQTDHDRVGNMLEWEANRLLNKETPFWRYEDRTIFYEPASDPDALPRDGDTAFEENLWNSNCLVLAACMMPGHPNAAAWESKAARFVMTASSVNADNFDEANWFNGHTVSEWCQNGFNLKDDYIVVNHNIMNPDYTQALHLQLINAMLYGLANQPIPEAMIFNARRIYGSLQTVKFSGQYTIYKPGTPTLYYPQGTDWGNRRPYGYYAMDEFMNQLGIGYNDSVIPYHSLHYSGLHLNDTNAMQGRTGKPFGQIVLTNYEDKNPGREEWAMFSLSTTSLMKTVKNDGRVTFTDREIDLPNVL